MEYKRCPNCDKKIDGILSSRIILKSETIDFINSFKEDKSEAYCNDCGTPLVNKYISEIKAAKEKLIGEIEENMSVIPIITINNPTNWSYRIIDMISAQSVSGTGFLSELSSSWTDFLGGQSNSLASKISSGEDFCRNKLRYQCALMGGNAILATDIDYSEVGGGRGMLMVCMSGTAVELDLANDFFSEKRGQFEKIKDCFQKLSSLSQIKIPAYYQ